MGNLLDYFHFWWRSEDNTIPQVEEGRRSQQCLEKTTDQRGNLKGENQQVSNLQSQIDKLSLELDEKTERLSAYLSTRLSADERHLENVVETVRPSSLGKRYRELESTEWVSAKEQIDNNDIIPSRDALKLLCFLMDEAFHAARLEVSRRETEILDTLLSPVQCRIPSSNNIKEIPELQCIPDSKEHGDTLTSPALKNEVLKCMKKTSHLIDLSGLEDNVKVKAAEKFRLPEGFFVSNDETLKYLAACCRLAWQFNLVQPPMVVSTEPGAYNKDIHEKWYECDADTDSEIEYYIWPVLFNHEGGRVAVKGRVMLSKRRPQINEDKTAMEEANHEVEL